MRLHLLTTSIKWSLSLGLLGGLVFGLFLIHAKMQAERAEEEGGEKAGAQTQSRANFVILEEDEAERYGLKTEPARSVRWYPRVSVYGRIIANPQATAEVRSPFAGTLRAASGKSWPTLGQRVRAGQTLGWVDVRVGPEVRLDLQNKLADARIRQRGAEEEIKIEQERADSLRRVTSQEIISRAELDAALIHLAQAKTQLATAKASAGLWRKALEEVERRKEDGSSWSQPLTAPADGEVTDLPGRLGMSVETGSPILVLVDFLRPLVRLDIPPEILALGGPPSQCRMQIAECRMQNALGSLAGPAPRVDTTSQFISYWYEINLAPVPPRSGGTTSALWRPGMQVTAEVRGAEAAARPAVAVPAGAVLYHEGRSLVYVRIGPEKFQRREVHLLGQEGDRWIVSVRRGNLPIGVAAEEVV